MNKREEILGRLEDKLTAIGQDTDVHLEGLVWAKPITYWDYIQTDVLLNLQVQRTTLPDEMIFIMYHQVNELLFKMTLWEANQLTAAPQTSAAVFAEKIGRMSRYFDVLSSSFTIMSQGMEYEQYLKFRNTLTPASGFQSAQYRMVEFASTNVELLADARFRHTINKDTPVEEAYEHLYWHAAGKDYTTGKKSTLIRLFEERYKPEFLRKIEEYRGTNIWARYQAMPEAEKNDPTLIAAMRHYDHTVNISWVMAHYHAAASYLDKENKKEVEGTGGSDWKKYMHPRYQRRIFFPGLWSPQELSDWGTNV